jgi:hypothetical protein
MDVGRGFRASWSDIKTRYLERARSVYLDNGAVELLRWQLHTSPLPEFWACGIHDVRSLEPDEDEAEVAHAAQEGPRDDHGHEPDTVRQSRADVIVVWTTGGLHRHGRRIGTLVERHSETASRLEVVVLTSVDAMAYGETPWSSYTDMREHPFQTFRQTWLNSVSDARRPGVRIAIELFPWHLFEMSEDVWIMPSETSLMPDLGRSDALSPSPADEAMTVSRVRGVLRGGEGREGKYWSVTTRQSYVTNPVVRSSKTLVILWPLCGPGVTRPSWSRRSTRWDRSPNCVAAI